MKKIIDNYIQSKTALKPAKKQQGATLISALTFLVLMTVVSVSAMKVSIVDILIAGNDQSKSQAFVSAGQALAKNADFYTVFKKIVHPDTDANPVTGILETEATVIELSSISSHCSGIDGRANSIAIGDNNVASCKHYLVTAKGFKNKSQISDTHVISVAKSVPNDNTN